MFRIFLVIIFNIMLANSAFAKISTNFSTIGQPISNLQTLSNIEYIQILPELSGLMKPEAIFELNSTYKSLKKSGVTSPTLGQVLGTKDMGNSTEIKKAEFFTVCAIVFGAWLISDSLDKIGKAIGESNSNSSDQEGKQECQDKSASLLEKFNNRISEQYVELNENLIPINQ